jgi:hypothetical protein
VASLQYVLLTSNEADGITTHDNVLLADVYYSQGRYVEAENLLMSLLTGDEELFGIHHPYSQATVWSLGVSLSAAGSLQ